jgi:flagellar M-ring protein FliF
MSAGRRIIAIGAAAAMFAAVLFLSRGVNSPNYALLFGGLEPSAAGDVITALDQQGVKYEVRGNAIYVDAGSRDSLRMTLAGRGLPASSGQGYELLDSLTGFGTTAQMFDAAYWRAKEGELARTILASPHIRAARVHISTPAGRPFQRDAVTTASITIQSTSGTLSTSHVKALQYLVAAAVSGLAPDDVAIIDGEGGLLSGNEATSTAQGGDERAEALRAQAERLLIARVGAGNAVVEISVDTIMETETISTRTIDPDSRVAISTDVQERSGKSSDSRGGDVTVASNLPDGDAGTGSGSAQDENTETRALTNYEVSQTQRDVLRAPGAVRRLTVAVLVNDVATPQADGSVTFTPRTEEELTDLQDLVASAVGLDTNRGDEITVRSMAFEPIPELGTEVIDPTISAPLNIMQLIQIGALAVVALVLGLFVVRPILSPSPQPALPPPSPGGASLIPPGEILNAQVSELNSPTGQAAIGQMTAENDAGEDPVDRLRQMISEREDESIQILQSWMEESSSREQV